MRTIFSQQAESNGDPPPEALQNVVKIVEKMRESSPDIVTPLSFCGRVANVLIWEEVHWALLKEKVQPGTFIRLRNVDIRRWQYNPFRCKWGRVLGCRFCVFVTMPHIFPQ